jgi:hypothetical protein
MNALMSNVLDEKHELPTLVENHPMKKLTKVIPVALIIGVLSACSGGSDKGATAQDSLIVDTIAGGTPNSVEANDDLLLQPGSSAGKIIIGQNAEKVYALLGKADAGDAAMQKSVSIWYKDHNPKSYATAIYTVRDTGDNPAAGIQQVRVTSPAFKTADAIGVSSSLEEIKKKYRITKVTDVTDSGAQLEMYDSLAGIAFETDNKGICKAVIIHKANESLKTTSLPLR